MAGILDATPANAIAGSDSPDLAPRELVKRSWESQASHSAPVIDWNGKLGLEAASGGRPSWLNDFVDGMGQSGNPNSKIRVKL